VNEAMAALTWNSHTESRFVIDVQGTLDGREIKDYPPNERCKCSSCTCKVPKFQIFVCFVVIMSGIRCVCVMGSPVGIIATIAAQMKARKRRSPAATRKTPKNHALWTPSVVALSLRGSALGW